MAEAMQVQEAGVFALGEPVEGVPEELAAWLRLPDGREVVVERLRGSFFAPLRTGEPLTMSRARWDSILALVQSEFPAGPDLADAVAEAVVARAYLEHNRKILDAVISLLRRFPPIGNAVVVHAGELYLAPVGDGPLGPRLLSYLDELRALVGQMEKRRA